MTEKEEKKIKKTSKIYKKDIAKNRNMVYYSIMKAVSRKKKQKRQVIMRQNETEKYFQNCRVLIKGQP